MRIDRVRYIEISHNSSRLLGVATVCGSPQDRLSGCLRSQRSRLSVSKEVIVLNSFDYVHSVRVPSSNNVAGRTTID